MSEIDRQLAERVRAALTAYEDAGLSGLCAEGRWEYTIGVLRQLDLEPLLRSAPPDSSELQNDPKGTG
jgi:hypothetical protein